ncbi:hypothetical protein ES703_82091 [subsurface metagenome]
MYSKQFFNTDLLDLPKERSGRDIVEYLSNIFDEYKTCVNALSLNDMIGKAIRGKIVQISFVCDQIIESISKYLKGFPNQAYKILEECIENIKSDFDHLIASDVNTSDIGSLYRMRLGDHLRYSKDDLFHIPFHKRYKVATQRYSISGLPCLYLGGSVYICWVEMNKPDYNKIHLSRFEPEKGTLKILDFGYRPGWWAATIDFFKQPSKMDEKFRQFIISQAICWPMLAACSIVVEKEDGAFNPEYIITKMILEWVRANEEVDGIRYFSVHEKKYPLNPKIHHNYVFPVQEIRNEGFCQILKKKFKLTEAASWQILKSMSLKGYSTAGVPRDDIELIPGIPVTYYSTDFGEIEIKLNNMDVDYLR